MAEHEGKVAGMVGLRPLSDEIAEMKRLFVLPAFQGKQMAKLVTANALYRRMGFYEIPPYRFNPFPDAMFWEKTIA
nr:GNAT family N-acetyltransferase [Hydrogenophilus thermoluteolus]